MAEHSYGFVMILDDSYMDSMVLKHILLSLNYAEEIKVFGDPLNALNHFIDQKIKKFPDIIFLDLNLPGMNGFQFLDCFLKLSKYCGKTKVIMTTSSDDMADIEKSAEYSCIIQYIIKPVKKIDLEFGSDQMDFNKMMG